MQQNEIKTKVLYFTNTNHQNVTTHKKNHALNLFSPQEFFITEKTASRNQRHTVIYTESEKNKNTVDEKNS